MNVRRHPFRPSSRCADAPPLARHRSALCRLPGRGMGVPEFDSRALFEKLILDGFQAGLSWITILRKRDAFRAAFANFDPEKIARFNAKKIAALMNNPGIIRNRAKIEGTVVPHGSTWRSRRRKASPISCGSSSMDGRSR